MFSKWINKIPPLPIALKVTLWYTLFMGIIFACVMAYTVRFTESMHLSLAHDSLEEALDEAQRKPHKFHGYDDGVYLAHYSASNILLRGQQPPGMPTVPFNKHSEIKMLQEGKQEYQYKDLALNDGTWLRGAIATSTQLQSSRRYLWGLLLALPVFIILAALGGYRIIKKAFQPVKQISTAANDIGTTKDLSTRILLGPGRDEIHTMAEAFNTMLDRIEGSVQREKKFSSDVSHELRTPVAVIMSESEYGKDYTTSIEEAKEGFASIFRQSQGMSKLINQILELARMENKPKLTKEEVNLSQLTEDLATTYTLLAQAKGITLTTEITPNLRVLGQSQLLQRAIANYLDNALKFTRDRIKLSLKQKDTKAYLTVEDNGCGLAPEELEKIWHRLYQSNTSRHKDEESGLGLGLSLVAEIAKLHQGRAIATSTLGKGSIFILEISLQS